MKVKEGNFLYVIGLRLVPPLVVWINILAMFSSLPASVQLFKTVLSSWAMPGREEEKKNWLQETIIHLALVSTEI